jgi:hypothetical protein
MLFFLHANVCPPRLWGEMLGITFDLRQIFAAAKLESVADNVERTNETEDTEYVTLEPSARGEAGCALLVLGTIFLVLAIAFLTFCAASPLGLPLGARMIGGVVIAIGAIAFFIGGCLMGLVVTSQKRQDFSRRRANRN